VRIVAVVLQAPRCIALSCVPTTDDYAIYVFILMRGPPLPPPERPPLGVRRSPEAEKPYTRTNPPLG